MAEVPADLGMQSCHGVRLLVEIGRRLEFCQPEAERRAPLAEQAQWLAKELAEVEAELERIGTAEQVVTQLLAEQDDDPGGDGSGGEADED
jgi:hypothetical protein